jgi:hypothetical protein
MAAPVNVAVEFIISVGVVNAASDDFCHFVMVPVFPVKVKVAGVVPEQIVCPDDTVPPVGRGVTVIVTLGE